MRVSGSASSSDLAEPTLTVDTEPKELDLFLRFHRGEATHQQGRTASDTPRTLLKSMDAPMVRLGRWRMEGGDIELVRSVSVDIPEIAMRLVRLSVEVEGAKQCPEVRFLLV